STSSMFGGNSNWRGPVWMPVNYLFIHAMKRYGSFYGDAVKVECPTGSGNWMSLTDVAEEMVRRLTKIFLPGPTGDRPVYGEYAAFHNDADRELIQFYEYYHGETGRGLGASHQTGWSALIATLLQP
ncbi:MAG TPA: glucosidase, partial [Chitinophagaceae bacterium]